MHTFAPKTEKLNIETMKTTLHSLALWALLVTFTGFANQASAQRSLSQTMQMAANGDCAAQYDLAIALLFGEGIPQDSAKAMKYFTKSADAGYAPAQLAMGNAYRDGDGVEKDPAKAVGYFEKAAQQGDAEAMLEAAKLYDNISAGTWDWRKRDEWFGKAAAAGSEYAQAEVAYRNMSEVGDKAKQQKSLEELEMMVQKGNTHAMLRLGDAYYMGRYVDESRVQGAKFYLQAAEAGNVQAMMEIALCYRNGKGVKMLNKEMAKWYGKAAEAGNPDGMYNYARCLEAGDGVEKNAEEAMKWYKKGVANGQSDCMVRIAKGLLTGEGVKKDAASAIQYLRKAADLHNGTATTLLGDCYEKGVGVKQDSKKAMEMWALSYEYGNRAGAEKYARGLEDFFTKVMQNPNSTEAQQQEAMEAREKATDIWHDIVRWHDDAHPLPLKENPETGDWETDTTLTY